MSRSDRGERSHEARSSRKKVVEGAYCRSVIVRATKRRRRIFSLGRCHDSDRGERSREARARTEKWSSESSAVLRACERPNVGDVDSPRGEVTPVIEGREAMRPELALKEVVEGVFSCSVRVRAKGLEPIRTRHQILSLAWLPITTRSQNPSEDS